MKSGLLSCSLPAHSGIFPSFLSLLCRACRAVRIPGRIAQGHGSTLRVESQEGQGTTFSVALPLNGAAHQPAT